MYFKGTVKALAEHMEKTGRKADEEISVFLPDPLIPQPRLEGPLVPRLQADLKLTDAQAEVLNDALPTVMFQLETGSKIQAIAVLRHWVPCTLLAAKMAVEGPIQDALDALNRLPKLRVVQGGK